ncbi:MAG: serine/threonine-protein kinase [Sandaracinaceae bacterium]
MGAAGRGRDSLPPAGTVLGERYRLARLIAEGGMGAVYEAVDQTTDTVVAVKLLHPELSRESDIRRRFRRESSVLKALDHPAIVRIFDIGAGDDELLYSVMERLEGRTLLEVLTAAGTMEASGILPIVQGIAGGLEAAHEHGVIHGDLTPSNVFILGDGSEGLGDVKLLDFGLSKVLGLERLTRTGELMGTPAYMAPELLTGKGELDERIDTYSFGVLLYQCLSGRPPFEGNVPGKLMMDIVMGKATPLDEVTDGVPSDVVAVVAQAMSRQREARFGSARALCRAYTSALAG